MKKFFTVFFVFISSLIFVQLSINVSAQVNPDIEWHSHSSEMVSIVTDDIGNIYVTGQTGQNPTRTSYCITIKYNKNGNEIWRRKYNESISNSICFGYHILLDNDSNVIVMGRSTQAGHNYFLIKYDQNGNTIWDKEIHTNMPSYGYINMDHSKGKGMVIDNDNNIYMTTIDMEYNNRYLIRTMKFNPNGDTTWSKDYFTYKAGSPRGGIVIDEDSNVYVAGKEKFGSSVAAVTIKYNSEGDFQWKKIFRPWGLAHARGIDYLGNNLISVTGMIDTPSRSGFIVNYDSSGNELWSHVIDSSYFSGYITLNKSKKDKDNNIIVAGSVQNKFLLAKYTYDGNLLWTNKINAGNGSERDLVLDSSNNSYITGSSINFDTIKVDSNGEILWHHSYNNRSPEWSWGNKIKLNKYGLFVTGHYGTFKIKTNTPPVAICKDIELEANENCQSSIDVNDINNGSYDPDDDDQITLSIDQDGPLSLGVHYIVLSVTDREGLTDTCISTVVVKDKSPPVIENLTLSQNILWPVNHKMIPVTIFAEVYDNCDSSPSVKIISVEVSDSDKGSGNTEDDWEITGDLTLNLRAERSGNGKGRTYIIKVQAVDKSGNSKNMDVYVIVPKSKKEI